MQPSPVSPRLYGGPFNGPHSDSAPSGSLSASATHNPHSSPAAAAQSHTGNFGPPSSYASSSRLSATAGGPGVGAGVSYYSDYHQRDRVEAKPYGSALRGDTTTTTAAATAPTSDDEAPFARPEVFEDMVGDLRRTFMGWLKRTDSELKRERSSLVNERIRLQKEREKLWSEFNKEKTAELEALAQERKRLNLEAAATMKQIAVERDEARRRLEENREKYDHQIKSWKRRLAMEREQFLKEVAAFEEERNKVADANIAAQTMVEFNVGGVVFETSQATMLQQPGSLLEGIVSGRHSVARDKAGRIFLDRDSHLFRTILQFLREPAVPPCPRDSPESVSLCNEANYYGIKFFPFPLVFALGGHDGEGSLSSVEFLDVVQRCWRPCSSMETPRTYAGYAHITGRIVAFGGQNLDYRSLCDAECYDVLRDTWAPAPAMTQPRKNLGSASLHGCIYAVGGYDGANILNSVEAYDLRMKNWREVAPMNQPRSGLACAVVGNDFLWALGGSKGERLRSVERYEARMDTWELFPAEMLEVRSAACAASHLGYVYVFGGTDNSHAVHASVETLDSRGSKWMFCQPMPQPRIDAAAVVTSGTVLVAGGQNEAALRSTIFFRPDLDEWKAGADMTCPRYGHGLLVSNI